MVRERCSPEGMRQGSRTLRGRREGGVPIGEVGTQKSTPE